jgi:hypothetical protein
MRIPIISNGLPATLPIAIPATNKPRSTKETIAIVLGFKSNPRALAHLHTINPKIDEAIRTTRARIRVRSIIFEGSIDF